MLVVFVHFFLLKGLGTLTMGSSAFKIYWTPGSVHLQGLFAVTHGGASRMLTLPI